MWKLQVACRMCGTAPQCSLFIHAGYTVHVHLHVHVYTYTRTRTHTRTGARTHKTRCQWNGSGSLGAFVVLVQLFCRKLFQFLWTLLSTGKGFSSRCPHLSFSNLENWLLLFHYNHKILKVCVFISHKGKSLRHLVVWHKIFPLNINRGRFCA